MRIVNISDPSAPVEVGAFSPQDPWSDWLIAQKVFVSGNLAYVTSYYSDGFRVIDVSDPAAPVQAGKYDIRAGAAFAAGNHAFVTGEYEDSGYLHTFAIDESGRPTLAGKYYSGVTRAVAVTGNLAVMAEPKSLAIADIADPSNPTLLKRTTDFAGASDIKIYKHYACVIGGGYLRMVDLATPTDPLLVGSVYLPCEFGLVSGDYAYLTSYNGLHIVDISAPSTPVPVSFISNPLPVGGAYVQGNLLYIAGDTNGLRIFDITDATNPAFVSSYTPVTGAAVWNVWVSGHLAYLVVNGGLQVLDVSTPANLTPLGFVPLTTGSGSRLTVSGDYAFLNANAVMGGLSVVDISDPSLPTEVARGAGYDGGPYAGLALKDDLVYYAGGGGGLTILQSPLPKPDTEPPVITCPPNVTAGCSTERLVPVTWPEPVVTDNRPGVTVVCVPASGSGFAIGTTVVTCTATDAAGNTASCSFTVTRASMGFTGFMSPIGGADDTSGGSFDAPVRAFKLGSTIPVKFAATSCGGPVLTGVHTLKAIKYSSSTTSDPAIDATPTDGATAGNQFRLTDSQWHFNLSTKSLSQGTWKLVATLSDGSEHFVWITSKK